MTPIWITIGLLWTFVTTIAQFIDWFVPVEIQHKLLLNKIPFTPVWIWTVGIVTICSIAIFEHSYKSVSGKDKEISDLEDNIRSLLEERPKAKLYVECETDPRIAQVFLIVENHGAGADFWGTVEFKENIQNYSLGEAVGWTHTYDLHVTIPKGQKHKIFVAQYQNLDMPTGYWKFIYGTNSDSFGEMRAKNPTFTEKDKSDENKECGVKIQIHTEPDPQTAIEPIMIFVKGPKEIWCAHGPAFERQRVSCS